MIHLHPSLGISNAPSTPPRITDPSYIDRIYEFVGVQKAQFSLVIEASNGTVLDDIKETRLTAHLFDVEGRELTEHLTALSLYWEEHNEAWTEVGRGWSYLVNDTSRFLRLLRVRVSQLDIMTALDLTIDAETKKTLAGIMVQQEVKITSSSSIYSRIPSAALIHQQLVDDARFRELVKGDKGDTGKDADPVRPNLLTGFMGVEKKTLSAMGTNNTHAKLGISRYLEAGKMYAISADVEMLEGSANAITLVLWSGSDFLAEGKTTISGTKTRASLIFSVPAGANIEEVDILGYAGERRKTSGNLAKYYNIKLEEVSSDTDKASAYIPHTDDLKGEPGKSVTLADLNIDWNGTKLVIAGKESQSLLGPAGPTGAQGIRGPQGIQGPKGAEGKPGAKGEPGKSVTLADLNIDWNGTKLVIAGKESQSLLGPAGPAGVQGIQGPKGAEGKPGAKGEPGKSPSPKEVADTINTADWQNQIASATASNIIKTPTLSDKLRKLVQPDTTELIKRLSLRTMRQDILSQNGDKYLINVPAFALFEPEVEDGAAISLQVSIRQPIGSCTNPNNHDERGYFFIVKSWEPIYTTSAEKLCNKGGEIKVYYDSEQCAESLLSIKLERSNDHWIFVNYYDFAASIQADCTQIVPQSHYSNKSQDEILSYAPLQYLSGKKRNAVLPSGRVGLVIRVWANKWVGDVRVYTETGESLYNTSHSNGDNVSSEGVLIPAGHIGEFMCINEEKIWLYTDLSR